MEANEPHPLCLKAIEELQDYLSNQQDWTHNFGLSSNQDGAIIGKMFGVLVVQNQEGRIGYLSAFSGKLAGGNHHAKFVPPVFDSLEENGFLSHGMIELSRMNREIKIENELQVEGYRNRLQTLKANRRNYSNALQYELFDHYSFMNLKGEEKSLNELFKNASYKNPPAGAGECAGPKLLQYAFIKGMKPFAIAEFWWGQSPKSTLWKHGHYYPCCREKCEPILTHMLDGLLNLDKEN